MKPASEKEPIPQDSGLEVLGKKKEYNPMEDFWMERMAIIERQYEDEMIQMKRSLLDNRFNVVLAQKEKISGFKEELNEKKKAIRDLKEKSTKLEKNLKSEREKSSNFRRKLEKSEINTEKVKEGLSKERIEKSLGKNEISKLRRKLTESERNRNLLNYDIEIRDEERDKIAHLAEQTEKERKLLTKTLYLMDHRLKSQTMATIKREQEIEELLGVTEDREISLWGLRAELKESCETLRQIRIENSNLERKNLIAKKNLTFAEEHAQDASERLKESARQISHWREEADFKNRESNCVNLANKEANRENTKLRSKVASLNHNLNQVQDELKSLSNLRQKLNIELTKAKGHQQALEKVIAKNVAEKERVSSTLSKSEEYVEGFVRRDSQIYGTSIKNEKKKKKKECQEKSGTEVYEKKIWGLERQLEDLEKKLIGFKRRENVFSYRLQRLKRAEQQIIWGEKALVQLEREKKNFEEFTHSFAMKLPPRRIPFERLVTDPSLLDKITRQRILIKRLFKQTAKVAEAKRLCETLVKYKRDEEPGRPINPWKLDFWRQPSPPKELFRTPPEPDLTYRKSIEAIEADISHLCEKISQFDIVDEPNLPLSPAASSKGSRASMSHQTQDPELIDQEVSHPSPPQKQITIESEASSSSEQCSSNKNKGNLNNESKKASQEVASTANEGEEETAEFAINKIPSQEEQDNERSLNVETPKQKVLDEDENSEAN